MNYLKLLPLLLCLLAFTACEDDDDPILPIDDMPPSTLIGTWRLTETLTDPGDGSGTFQRVDSERRITFLTDSTYQSNAIICDFSTETNQLTVLSEGTVDLEAGILRPDDCRNVPAVGTEVRVRFTEGDLILGYRCFEACEHKYRRE